MNMIKEWLSQIVLRRLVGAVVKVLVSYAAAHAGILSHLGISLSINEVEMQAGVFAALEALHHILVQKYPDSIGKII